MAICIFLLGYLAIVLERPLRLHKSATALLTGTLCWTARAISADSAVVESQLLHQFAETAQVLFFLLAAMTVVELIDTHHGFDVVTSRIRARSRRLLLAVVAVLAFFLSALLDNMTTAIVMVSLVRKLVPEDEDRMLYASVVVIAANAGGAWSPIGDVTTTMLWTGQQITATSVVTHLFVPSLVSVVVPVLWIGSRLRGSLPRVDDASTSATELSPTRRDQLTILGAGVGILLLVPVFKMVTHLPPVIGMLLGLGLLWTLVEVLHRRKAPETREALSVAAAIQRVDSANVLFFLGILLAIGALASDGTLAHAAQWLDRTARNVHTIAAIIGLASSVVDNVPIVAAAQGMYPLSSFPTDHTFWLFLAYCGGTGGSLLVIGSAAGVAAMGVQNIGFGWYARRITLPVLAGYGLGGLTYVLMHR